MDTAVAMVQAYLHLNGYFTVAEYPVMEAFRGDRARSVTDLDILAFRFANAGHEVIRRRSRSPLGGYAFAPDPRLGCPPDRPDMIVGEVKEGRARFNPATRDRVVLEVALARFGCCPADRADTLARDLLANGHARTPAGHTIRMIAFGDASDDGPLGTWITVPMVHVVRFLRQHLRQHWEVLRHAQMKDHTLGTLALIEKWGAEAAPKRGVR